MNWCGCSRAICRRTDIAVLLACWLLAGVPAAATAPPLPAVEAFADEAFGNALAARGIPGAAFAYVAGCDTLLAKGYGWADIAARERVDAATPFRLGSIAKGITATLVVQAGLDLRADIRGDLPWLRLRYDRPLTLHHLLTHTGGLADGLRGTATRDPRAVARLQPFLRRHLPPQVIPPGAGKIYSSLGFALAGLVYEKRMGGEFARLAERRLFAPLGMERSSAGLGGPLRHQAATGYRGAANTPFPREYFYHFAPGGGGYASAADMARLLQALCGCRPDVLAPDAVDRLTRRQFAHHQGVAGMAYGFEEWRHGSQRWLAKGGVGPGAMTYMVFHPQKRVGFFLAYNKDRDPFYWDIIVPFLDRFFPASTAPAAPVASATGGAAGTYRHRRYAATEPLISLGMREPHITRSGDALLIDGVAAPPLAGGLFADAQGLPVGFKAIEGRDHFFRDKSDLHVRISWWETSALHRAVLAGSLLVQLFILLGYAAHRVVQRWRRRSVAPIPSAICYLWPGCNIAIALLAALGFADGDMWKIHYGYPAPFVAAQVLAWASAAIGAWCLVGTARLSAGLAAWVCRVQCAAGVLLLLLLAYWRVFYWP